MINDLSQIFYHKEVNYNLAQNTKIIFAFAVQDDQIIFWKITKR